MSVALSYDMLTRNLDRSLAITAKTGSVKLESAYYLNAIKKMTSIEDFLKDTRAFKFAMTAFGLEDMAHAKGYIRKVLEGGVEASNSLANRTNDPKIQAFARTFDFVGNEEETMTRAVVGQAVVDKYVRQTMEITAGEQDGEGVRLALNSQRMAGEIKTPIDILADKALSKVVRTALGMPNEMAAADIDKQAAAIAKRINIEDFQNPAKVKAFITRFTAMWDATEGAGSDPRLALFNASASSNPTVSLNLAMSINQFRLGGR